MAISRVIEVSFGRSSVALVRVNTAYFYNNGILFKPTDIDLPASYQVHWADSPQASSTLETIGTAEGAPIPDDLWDRSRVIYGWIYLHPTEDSGVTAYEVRIYKNVRAGLPDGTEPTPAEQSTIDQLISALNTAVEQTGEDVESAEQARDDAITARNNAQGFAENAQSSAQASASSAESASQSAQTASEKASASAQSASQSAQIKSDVEDLVDDAQTSADASAQSASASANSASQASGYAQSASASASSASGYASSAQTSANTASTKAQDASTSAQTASAKASEASGYATTASNKATEASGYATSASQAKTDAESARDSAQGYASDAQGYANDAQASAESISASASQIAQNTADILKAFPTDTASGAIASFSDGADDLPLKSLVVDINPVQDLSHGDPSPENICPISGWTEVNVNHSDADMTNPTTLTIQLGQTVYGGKLDVLSGVLTIDKAMVDLGTLYWKYVNGESEVNFFRSEAVTNAKSPSANAEATGAIFSTYATISAYNVYLGNIGGGIDTKSNVRIYDPNYTDAAAFKTAMSGVQLCYELAEPIEIQLTPNQINSLLGVNNIWADSGDTETVYCADTKLYIQKKIAEAISALS